MLEATLIGGPIPLFLQAGGGGAPQGYVYGAVPSNNVASPNDAIDISAGVVRDVGNTDTMTLDPGATIDFTVNGAGGLDVGALAADSWYSLWVIKSSTGAVSVLGSLSELAPTLPAPFTLQRRVGWARTNGAGAFFPFLYVGQGYFRVHSYAYRDFNDTQIGAFASTGAYIAVDCSAFIPPGQRAILLRKGGSNAATRFESKPGDGAQAVNAGPYRTVTASAGMGVFPFPEITSAARGLQVRTSNLAAFFDVSALGFFDVL